MIGSTRNIREAADSEMQDTLSSKDNSRLLNGLIRYDQKKTLYFTYGEAGSKVDLAVRSATRAAAPGEIYYCCRAGGSA